MRNLFLKTYGYIFIIFAIYYLALPITNGTILSMNTIQITMMMFIKVIVLSIILIGLEIIYWKIKPVNYDNFIDTHK